MADYRDKDNLGSNAAGELDYGPSSPKRQRSGSTGRSISGDEGPKQNAAAGKDNNNNTTATGSATSSEDTPPLPDEAPPEFDDKDGWDWEKTETGAIYFINRITNAWQWENPRVPAATGYGSYDRYANNSAPGTTPGTAPGTTPASGAPGTSSPPKRLHGGYNPAIHGSYDPTADYAIAARKEEEEAEAAAAAASSTALAGYSGYAGRANTGQDYTTVAHINRRTGRFQDASVNPDNHNDENKSRRQMGAFFDVDAAANSHNGRSLKAERRNKTLSKKELKAYKDKRRDKKEEKRRAWLMD